MKKLLTIWTLFLFSFNFNAQSYNGNVYYEKAEWDGITANCNVSVIGSTSAGGVSFEKILASIDIQTITIAQRVIPANQIPTNVINGIKKSARVQLIFDVYVNNVLRDNYGETTIGWAKLQGLPNSEGYKPAVKEAGYALYNSGAIEVRNVRVRSLTYRVDQTYYDQIRKEIAGIKNTNSNTSKPSNTNTGSTNVLINGTAKNSSSSNNSNLKDVEKKTDTTTTYSNNYIPKRELTQKEKEVELIQNATNLINNIANDIEADRLLKEERYKREQERIARNKAYGNELIKNNSYNAVQNGDENAIRKTYLGYMNINDKSTEEGNDKKAMEFLEKIISTHNSNFAKTQLIDDNQRTITYYDNERKSRITKTILNAGLGGALIAGSILFSDEISSDEMLGSDTGPIVLTGTTIFGGYLVWSGIFNSFFISDYSKSRDEYISAKNRIEELNKKHIKISFSSGYNKNTNDLIVGLNIRF
jgi:hypothetical protein